jgi:hypothetical protein
MKRHHVLALISVCFISFGTYAAEPGFYLGVEGGRSRADVESETIALMPGTLIDERVDESDRTFGLYLGYSFSRHFAIELAYSDLGETRLTAERDVDLGFPVPGVIPDLGNAVLVPRPPVGTLNPVFVIPELQETTIDSKSFTLSLVGRYPLAETVSFMGRAGLSAHLLDADYRVWFDDREAIVRVGDLDESAGAALVGAGIEWDFHPNWHVRLQAQRHFMLDDASFISNVKRGDVTTFTVGTAYQF